MSNVLAFVSPKGGVGKSTQSVHLSYDAAVRYGQDVLLTDADPNHSALDYADRGTAEHMPFAIADAVGQLDQLRHLHSARRDLVIVDTPAGKEGAMQQLLTGADGRPIADMFLVLTGHELMDLRVVTRVIRHEIAPLGAPYRMVFARVPTSALALTRDRQDQARSRGIDVADTIIRRYAVYGPAHENDQTVFTMPGAHSYARLAEEDQLAFTDEILPILGIHRPRS